MKYKKQKKKKLKEKLIKRKLLFIYIYIVTNVVQFNIHIVYTLCALKFYLQKKKFFYRIII